MSDEVQYDPETGEVVDAPAVRPFAAWLREQRKGVTHRELTEGLAEVVKACLEHGKPGTLTLQIKVKPLPDGESVSVTDQVVVKAPEGERSAAIFFADEAGNLTRTNPNQPELPFVAEVPAPKIREVS